MKIRDEKGMALPLVMIAILIGGLVIPPFLNYVGTSLVGSRNYADRIETQYACDAGAEHAIWNLVDGGLADELPEAGDTISYDLDETINGETVNVIVSNAYDVLAWDDFNSNTWDGGGGWLDDWATYGTPETTSTGTPYEGAYHLRLNNTDAVSRSVDLSDVLYANVRFWIKVTDNYDPWSDYAYLRVSNDGETWQDVCRWSSSNDTYYSTYRFVSYPLASYGLSDTFYIRFETDTDSSEYMYVDDLDVVWMAIPSITVAEDDFESGDWMGGEGWLDDLPWTVTGNANVNSGTWLWPWYYEPHGGDYQAELIGLDDDYNPDLPAGDIMRPVDLSGQTMVRLRFWGRQTGFDNTDRMYLRVSSNNGTSWQTVTGFGRRAATGVLLMNSTWRYYDIDLSSYEMTSTFWIRFDGDHNRDDEYVWLDDIILNSTRAFCITVTVGDRILKVAVDLLWDVENILWWRYQT